MNPLTDDKKNPAEEKKADHAHHAETRTTPMPVEQTDPSERNKGSSGTRHWEYPRYVFKQGTGRLLDEDKGLYEAETRLVHDEDELSRLGDGWLNTPKEAAMSRNVTNANAQIVFNEDGTVQVTPKSTMARTDMSGDMHRRTMIDADETPKPRLDDSHDKRKK